jgi:hypothetical protein
MAEQPIIPEKQEREILRAVLTPEGHILLTITSSHTPSLSYIFKLLSVEIDKRIIDERMRSMQKEASPILDRDGNLQKRHNIVNFLRGKKN